MPVRPLLVRLLLLSVIVLAVDTIPLRAQVIKTGSPGCPAVALTYDLCPVRTASGFDVELIDFLIEHKIPATFFMSGRWMAKHEAEVRKLLAVPFSKSARMATCMPTCRCMRLRNSGRKSSVRSEY
ncbi:MAG: polysaccharide deacetylase family protein [Nitrospiraceae bacterium]